MKSWRDSLAVYRDPRVIAILFLGFASGLPLALTASTLAIRLTEDGVDMTTIGLFALVGTPYAFKFLWAPLLDRLQLPFLTRALGRRRGWLVAIQAALGAAIFILGLADPKSQAALVAGLAFLVAFLSATQDIVIDAFRVEILDEEQYAAGAAMVQFGYRVAMLTSGAGALFMAEALPWSAVYAVMAGLLGIGLLAALLLKEPAPPPAEKTEARGGNRLAQVFVAPFREFFARLGLAALGVIAFIVLFKLGDAVAGMMANPFYVKMGFSKSEIASVSKIFGFVATILGVMAGGVLAARFGILKSLMLGGVLQAGSNLMFVFQAMAGHDLGMLVATIGIENFTGGLGSAVFVAYLSKLCNLAYTASQYALFSALATLGRTLFASTGGAIVDAIGWVNFFLYSTAMALPGLILLLWIIRRFKAEA